MNPVVHNSLKEYDFETVYTTTSSYRLYGMHPVVHDSLKEYDFETVYTTTSSESKQDRHYRVNICFILLFTTCFDPYLGHPQAYNIDYY
jgi:hypothetical protein